MLSTRILFWENIVKKALYVILMLCFTHKADNSVTEQKRIIPHLLLLHSNTRSANSHSIKFNIYNFFKWSTPVYLDFQTKYMFLKPAVGSSIIKDCIGSLWYYQTTNSSLGYTAFSSLKPKAFAEL